MSQNHLGGLWEPGAGSWQGENLSMGPRDPYFPQPFSPLAPHPGWVGISLTPAPSASSSLGCGSRTVLPQPQPQPVPTALGHLKLSAPLRDTSALPFPPSTTS